MKLAPAFLCLVMACSGHAPPPQQPVSNSPQAQPPRGDLEARLAELEAWRKKHQESIDFLEQVFEQQKAAAAAAELNEPDPDAMFAVDVKAAVKAGQVEGPPTALVTIVEAWDFACPYCARLGPVLEELVKDYNGKLRIVYMNMVVHPAQVQMAHQYGCAAAKQGKFVEFKRTWWDKGFGPYVTSAGKDTSSLAVDNIKTFAATIAGLDVKRLASDAESEACRKRVQEDVTELEKFHVSATPVFFINGKMITGGLPKDELKQFIDVKLRIAEASKVPGDKYYEQEIMGKGLHTFRSKKDAQAGKP
jgi:protein-disulfide isomerase